MSDKETAPPLRPYMDRLLKKLADPSEAFHYINAAWQESPEVFIQAIKDVAQAVAVECRAPAPQPSKEEAEIAVDKMFKNWLSRHCFFYANKTLRASGWREIAILLYRRAATPQVTPTPGNTTIASGMVWYQANVLKQTHKFEGTSEQASPREFKPYMEDHEYYDPPQALPLSGAEESKKEKA